MTASDDALSLAPDMNGMKRRTTMAAAQTSRQMLAIMERIHSAKSMPAGHGSGSMRMTNTMASPIIIQ